MKTLLFLINILGIAIASPIKSSEILLRRGYGGNINSIYAHNGDLKNSSANENRNHQSGNDGHKERQIFLNLTKGYVIDDEVSAVDAVNLQEAYQDAPESLLLHGDASLVQSKGNSKHSTLESIDTYATFPTGKAVNDHHTDLITKSWNTEQNGMEHLREKNAVHGPVSTADGSVTQKADIFSDKQHHGGFQATSGFMAKKTGDALYSDHYHSFGNNHFSDEGMQGDDPGYADDSDSSLQEDDQSNSSQQLEEADSPSCSNEESKHSSTSKDSGSPKDSSGSTDANGSSDSNRSCDSSSSSESSDSSSSSDSNYSNKSDSSSLSDSSDSSNSSKFRSSGDSGGSGSPSDSNSSSTSGASHCSNDNSSSSDSSSFE